MTDFSPSRRAVLGGLGAAATALAAPAAVLTPSAQAAGARNIRLWRCYGSGLSYGYHEGTAYSSGGIRIARPLGRTSYYDPYVLKATRQYDYARWTTGWYSPGFAATQVIPSWKASTGGGSFISVWIQGRTPSGRETAWMSLGRWSDITGGSPARATVNGQGDDFVTVATDTLKARAGVALAAWRLRVVLFRPVGSGASPVLMAANAVTSAVPTGSSVSVPVSPVGVGRGIVLPVPSYSQMIHRGHYPQLNGGGEAWCSATSTAMVLDYFRAGPSVAETSWVRPTPHVNPQVDHVVAKVFDYGYQGSGNWAFNTAYATVRGLDGFVTRLRSLNEAERFIRAGIPLPVSTSFTRYQLSGAGFGTTGHIMVIVGFTSAGDVVVNDPASGMVASNYRVRRTYDRAQFESAWARSGGTAYVMRPWSRPLPARTTQPNW